MRDSGQQQGPNASNERRDRLTPLDVQQKEFRVSFRGYNEREVDEFLDKVTEELQRYEAQLMRMRSERASLDPATLDLDAESQRILRDARDRADAIVREAEARAAGIPAATAGDARAAVAPYLNREREFLQSLGSLVQDHAQTIRTMVEEARRRTEGRTPASEEPSAAPASEEPSAATGAAAPESVASEPASADVPDTGTDTASTDPAATSASEAGEPSDVVLVADEDEAADDRVRATADRGEQQHEPEGARSLRDLFWGDD